MIIRCIDVETLGLEAQDGVCEIGWCDVVSSKVGPVKWMLVNPGKPIPPIASAVHHITDEDVVGSPYFEDAEREVTCDELAMAGEVIYCAHNASFERKFIQTGETEKWICTYKVAVTLAPNAPSHNLQALRYWSKLKVDRDLASPPHRAGPDAYVCAHLLMRFLAKKTIEEMVAISAVPLLLPKLHFGKHAGKPCSEVPADYWDWVLKNITDDEDVQYTAKHWLKAASEPAAA